MYNKYNFGYSVTLNPHSPTTYLPVTYDKYVEIQQKHAAVSRLELFKSICCCLLFPPCVNPDRTNLWYRLIFMQLFEQVFFQSSNKIKNFNNLKGCSSTENVHALISISKKVSTCLKVFINYVSVIYRSSIYLFIYY